MATVACPECKRIFKSDADKPRCPFCQWDGTWKPEPDPDEQPSREKIYSYEHWTHT